MTKFLAVLALGIAACRSTQAVHSEPQINTAPAPSAAMQHVGADPGGVGMGTPLAPKQGHSLAAFAGGCFWGTEDAFRHVNGVTATAVGYTGGHTKNPTYDEVCTHTTGHAETVLVEFDPSVVTYDQLLIVFFAAHDATTMNRQGPDVGDQYRSAVFTFSEDQARAAKSAIAREQGKLGKTVVTQVVPIPAFYKAEEYHQQYDEKSGTRSCPIRVPLGT